MARPNKQGVDYFPLDVHLDDKFKFIEIKYKLEGFAILIKLMQKIYSYGYWYRWTDDEALLFSDELRADYETVKGVVDEALKRGVFNKEKFEQHEILTSTGIQKRFKEIVRRRKDVEVIEEYLLIDGMFGVNDDINPTSSSHNAGNSKSGSKQNDGKSTQSKVKESKQKQYTDEFESFWKEYPRKLDKKRAFKSFKSANKKHSVETIVEGTKGYARQVEQDKTETQFIKHASTFLNNDSYMDFVGREEIEPQKTEEEKEQEAEKEYLNHLWAVYELGEDYWENVEHDLSQYETAKKELVELGQL